MCSSDAVLKELCRNHITLIIAATEFLKQYVVLLHL